MGCVYTIYLYGRSEISCTFPSGSPCRTQSCLALYSFCANLLLSLIMWLIVSSLSPHSLHLLLCCVLSVLALIWLVLMALSCAAIRRDSVSLFRFYYYYYYYYYFWGDGRGVTFIFLRNENSQIISNPGRSF